MNFKALGLVSVVILLMACGQSTDIPESWKSVNTAEFTIQYPDSFDLDSSGHAGTKLIFYSKQTSSMDLFLENINLLTEDLTGQNITLDQYVELSEGQITGMIQEAEIKDSKRIKFGDTEYHRLVFTGTQGQLKLKWLQHLRIEDGTAYVLTFTAEHSQFDKYVIAGEKIMQSITIE